MKPQKYGIKSPYGNILASVLANNLLFPCLDFRRTLAMEYDFENPTPVSVHPGCIFIATANVGSQYTGTHKMDEALKGRFMALEIDPLGYEELCEVLLVYRKDLPADKVNTLVNLYTKINQLYHDCKITFCLNMRQLKTITDMTANGFTIYDAFYATVKGVGGKDGIKVVETLLNTHAKK